MTYQHGPELEAEIVNKGWQGIEFDPESGVYTADDGDDEGCRLWLNLWVGTNECSVESEEWANEKFYYDTIPSPQKASEDLSEWDDREFDYDESDHFDDDMDGDFDSGMASAGHGMDEDYSMDFGGDDDY